MTDDGVDLIAGKAPRDPEQLEAEAAVAAPGISSLTTLGAVHLTVSDLTRSAWTNDRVPLEEYAAGSAGPGPR